jgi:hypothetical protein
MNKIPQLPRKTFKMSDHGHKEDLFIVRYPTKEEHLLQGDRCEFSDMNLDNSINMMDICRHNRRQIQVKERNKTRRMAPNKRHIRRKNYKMCALRNDFSTSLATVLFISKTAHTL